MLTPHETPLLDYLGDPLYPARQTKHEWLDEALNAISSTINEGAEYASGDLTLTVTNGALFRVGDEIQIDDEVLLVTAISTHDLTVTRGYGSSTAAAHDDGSTVTILGNAALEGADALTSRETSRTRRANYTQIIKATVDVSGTTQAVSWIGVPNEYEHQKTLRLKECLWELERCVLRGTTPGTTDVGSDTVRRSMQGIMHWFSTNASNASSATMDRDTLDGHIQSAWDNGARNMNLLMVNSFQKRKISTFVTPVTHYGPQDNIIRNVVGKYETDFGAMDVMLNHNVPTDEVWGLDTDLIKVLPLQGRAFGHELLGKTGDAVKGEIVGEYTIELRNEAAHMRSYGWATS
jgi:hypothetical protein